MAESAVHPEPQTSSWAKFLRLGVIFSILSVWVWMFWSGTLERFSVADLQTAVLSAGPWGILGYLVAFVVGVLVYVPAFIFVIAGVLVWGPLKGAVVAVVATFISTSAVYGLVKQVAPKWEPKGILAKVLGQVQHHPVLAVAVIRVVFWIGPPANIGLTLSGVRYRDYAVGTMLGYTVVIAAIASFLEPARAWFGV